MAATVRIKPGTRAKLKKLAEQAGEPIPVVLENAIECFRRQRFLQNANHAYASPRKQPKAWNAEQAERRRWEATLEDGLKDD